MIYFLQAEPGGPIKIGFSGKMNRRLGRLMDLAARPLRVLAVMPGQKWHERRAQARFAHLRITGEWFRAGEDLLAFIDQEGRPWDSSNDLYGDPPRCLQVDYPGPSSKVEILGAFVTPEFKAWARSFSTSLGEPEPSMVRLALERLADEKGFRSPPKRI
jgi:hypothetical protein